VLYRVSNWFGVEGDENRCTKTLCLSSGKGKVLNKNSNTQCSLVTYRTTQIRAKAVSDIRVWLHPQYAKTIYVLVYGAQNFTAQDTFYGKGTPQLLYI
jgi:hypothetical protein